ncbi:hypothetical protein ABPG72_014513 [Tetrahymena utriculariae]
MRNEKQQKVSCNCLQNIFLQSCTILSYQQKIFLPNFQNKLHSSSDVTNNNSTDLSNGNTNSTDVGSGNTNSSDAGNNNNNSIDAGNSNTNLINTENCNTNSTDTGNNNTNSNNTGNGNTNCTDNGNGNNNSTNPIQFKKICNRLTGECCIAYTPDSCSCWYYIFIGDQAVGIYICDE